MARYSFDFLLESAIFIRQNLDFLNKSVDLLDLNHQEPGNTLEPENTQVQAEATHENIVLVTDTLECTGDVTSNGSFPELSVNVQPSRPSGS